MLGQDSGVSATAAPAVQRPDRLSARSARPSITVRLSSEQKARVAALAAASGRSESALALNALCILLDSKAACRATATPAGGRVAASDRITIRLRPGDGAVIAHRAAERQMKAATYLAALVRSHIAAHPPLATTELSALKSAVLVLAALGRLLAQAIRGASAGAQREDLQRTRAAVAALEERVVDFAEAALKSWESRSD
jgi:predicted transcriptional regulator